VRNIEIKARCLNLASARERAAALGAQPAGLLVQRDTYFHVPHGRLKLREINGETAELIQYSRPDATEARASDYLVVPVADPTLLREALARALGIRAVVAKRRELYLWRHSRIHLDDVEGLGSFLELETVLTEQSEADAREEIAAAVAALGIRDEDRVALSYVDLIESRSPCGTGSPSPASKQVTERTPSNL
jgi:predicted adenylyl cyclase CyaB